MRKFRLKMGGAILELFSRCPDMEVKGFSLVSKDWIVGPGELRYETPRNMLRQFENHVRRLRLNAGCGFAIAFIDGHFDVTTNRLFLHLHGVVAGNYISAFNENIRQKDAYIRTTDIHFPLKVQRMRDPAGWVSYMLKAFWVGGSSGLYGERNLRTRRVSRIPEPYATDFLGFINSISVGNTMIMIGCSIKGKRIEIKGE